MYNDSVSDAHYWQLYEQFCQGNQQASIELVNLLGNRLLQYIRRSCIYDSREAAEDCVQSTWIKLVEYCGKPLRQAPFWGFTCAIARNQSIDDYRKNTRQKRNGGETMESLEEYHQAEMADADADPAQLFELRETEQKAQAQLQAYKTALAALPDKQRLALTLQMAGYSLKEIAQQMDEKDETIKSHLRYAKDKLKKMLNNNQDIEP